VRTAFIEANQRGDRTATVSKESKARRAHTALECVDIADRCVRRLNNKGNRLLLAGKHPNKVNVACAREMVGFIRESLHQAAASCRHKSVRTLRPMDVDLTQRIYPEEEAREWEAHVNFLREQDS